MILIDWNEKTQFIKKKRLLKKKRIDVNETFINSSK